VPGVRIGKVEKAIMAPRLARKDKSTSDRRPPKSAAPAAPSPVAMLSPQEQEFRKKLKELRDHLTANADNVGKKFPEEARKMHYGETEHRSIYGEATAQDAKALHEEGIEFHRCRCCRTSGIRSANFAGEACAGWQQSGTERERHLACFTMMTGHGWYRSKPPAEASR
jgi:hypothetical protein